MQDCMRSKSRISTCNADGAGLAVLANTTGDEAIAAATAITTTHQRRGWF